MARGMQQLLRNERRVADTSLESDALDQDQTLDSYIVHQTLQTRRDTARMES